jgi:ATP-dependent helicase/nuclease subunit A
MAGPLKRTPQQRLAADPASHVWVAASAGTGKTHVLTDRILRLLLAGSPPDRILALTFTKAAASEMQNRLVKRLGDWQALDDAALDAELEALGAGQGPAMRHRARSLFALALDVPGGLKVQTLHAFAQGLLAAFPMEAGLPPGFRALDERDARQLKKRALAEAITEAQAAGDSAFLADLAELSILKGEGGVMHALDAMIDHGDDLLRFKDMRGLQVAVRRWLDVGADEKPGERLAQMVQPDMFDDGRLIDFVQMLERWGWKKPLEQAAAGRAWLALDGLGRAAGFGRLQGLLLTSGGEVRSFRQGEKNVPGIQAAAEDLAQDVLGLLDIDRRIATAELASRALRAGHRIVARYQRLKRAAVAIDYDDMIARTARLLGPAGMPGYVGWKLDSRFDHLLVDEAQDTNLNQWRIIRRLVEDYFNGEHSRRRSLFVVGDHKQAIYGFQGTDPQVFEGVARDLEPGAEAGGRPIQRVDLDLSFRSGPAVLDVVNAFIRTAGAEALGMGTIPPDHRPKRAEAPGEVVLWPVVTPAGDEADTDTRAETDTPVDTDTRADTDTPADDENGLEDGAEAADHEMARQLAAQVARWLNPGPGRLWLPAHQRYARPEDILILLRRRSWLMGALVAELHDRAVPVAGVDRLLLTEPLAVLDCLALVRFATQPEDDLNLACLLVSPFLGWNHEEIRALNRGRPGLWQALGQAASSGPRAADARDFLGAVLALADRVGPYAFLDTILSGPLGGRQRLLARLGPQANDPVDELLNQALAYEQANPPGLAGFLAWVEAEGSDVKRDADAPSGQVRLMTIHGAKGLEAPVVVLADSALQRRGRQDGYVVATLDGDVRLPLFHPPSDECPRKIREARDLANKRESEEDLRLLYVGLTRAADHLFIGGAVAASGLKKQEKARKTGEPICWHSRLQRVMEELGADVLDAAETGWPGQSLRWHRGDWTAPPTEATTLTPDEGLLVPHEVLVTVAPKPGRPSRPLTPSALPDSPPEGPAAEAMRAAARRGAWIHRLFERLPAVPPAGRADSGRRWLLAQGAGDQAGSILTEVLKVLEDPVHAALFGPHALAEAPVAGLVEGQVIAGVVDRLLVEDDRVLVVDFKTGLKVPTGAVDVPLPHLRQMAAYAAVLGQAFPGRRIEAALLYTAAPKFLLLGHKDMAGLLPLD